MKLLKFAAVLVLACGLCGCGYRLGSVLPSSIQTVYVEPFVNKSEKPGVDFAVTEAVKRQLRTDGTLKVVSSAQEADAVLSGVVMDVSRRAVVLAEDNLTREYELTIKTRVNFTQVNGSLKYEKLDNEGTVNFYIGSLPKQKIDTSRRRRGTQDFITGSTLPEAEKAALPVAVDVLAENLVSQVVEQGGW